MNLHLPLGTGKVANPNTPWFEALPNTVMSREYPAWKYGKVVLLKSLVVFFSKQKPIQQKNTYGDSNILMGNLQVNFWHDLYFSWVLRWAPNQLQPVVTGVRPPISRVITPFITSRAPPRRGSFQGSLLSFWTSMIHQAGLNQWKCRSTYQQEIIIYIPIYIYNCRFGNFWEILFSTH